MLMAVNSNEIQEKDINDVFDSIAFSEDQISSEAYQKGLIKGKEDGKFEGYHLGFHRGFQIGAEIGFYKGLTKVLYEKLSNNCIKNDQKIQNLLEKLTNSLDNFPKTSNQDEDILKRIGDIRASFRKLNSLLKLNISFPVTPSMSF